jgi:DNA-binding IclR family transcriptional regulator
MSKSSKPLVPALERGLAILEVLGHSRAGLSLSQLTRHLSLPKSSVHCLLRTLQVTGYLYKDNLSGKYRISLRICDLARQALNGMSLREQARPFLKSLADQTGLTVHLAVLEQGSCVLIEKVTPPGAVRTATWVGKQLGLHCTAIGKALIAHLPEHDVAGLIAEHGLIRYNDNTIRSVRQLSRELELVRQRGYALDDEEEEIGVRCIGAPIFNGNAEVVASLSVVGSTSQIGDDTLRGLTGMVAGAARRIGDHIKSLQLEAGNALPIPDTHSSELLEGSRLYAAARNPSKAANGQLARYCS